jgi:hypothetical protein
MGNDGYGMNDGWEMWLRVWCGDGLWLYLYGGTIGAGDVKMESVSRSDCDHFYAYPSNSYQSIAQLNYDYAFFSYYFFTCLGTETHT